MGYETIFLYVGVALGVSFLCSVLEAVLLSMTLSQINVLQNSGRRSGAIWAVLKEDVERPLTVILTLNTIAHTVGAIGVGSEVQNMYQDADFAVAVASGLLTLAVLLFSEILPKTIGATYWRQLAPASAYVLNTLLRLMWIVVVPIMAIRRVLPEGEVQPTVPRDELAALAEISGDEGSIDPDERYCILRHERVHVAQFRRYTWPGMIFLYILCPLPFAFAPGRAWLEWQGYRETLTATWEVFGPERASAASFEDEIVRRFTGPDYGWMWMRGRTISKAIRKHLKALHDANEKK